MPLYAYRCDCGQIIEALVRSGEEPSRGAEIGHVCEGEGTLKKLLSAPNIGRSAGRESAPMSTGPGPGPGAGCGNCGGAPGSCQLDN